MAIYIANENGDWWRHIPGQKLYVLDTNKLTYNTKSILEEEYSYSDGEFNSYGVEDAIRDYGTEITLNIEGENK